MQTAESTFSLYSYFCSLLIAPAQKWPPKLHSVSCRYLGLVASRSLVSPALTSSLDLEGFPIAQDIPVSEDDFVQHEPFARDPDKEDFEGYPGNAGASATYFYDNKASNGPEPSRLTKRSDLILGCRSHATKPPKCKPHR